LAEHLRVLASEMGCSEDVKLTASGRVLDYVLAPVPDVQMIQDWLLKHTGSLVVALQTLGRRAGTWRATSTTDADGTSSQQTLLDELYEKQTLLTNEVGN
jgi:hypothetical protein